MRLRRLVCLAGEGRIVSRDPFFSVNVELGPRDERLVPHDVFFHRLRVQLSHARKTFGHAESDARVRHVARGDVHRVEKHSASLCLGDKGWSLSEPCSRLRETCTTRAAHVKRSRGDKVRPNDASDRERDEDEGDDAVVEAADDALDDGADPRWGAWSAKSDRTSRCWTHDGVRGQRDSRMHCSSCSGNGSSPTCVHK
jgi:hypothetical protein